MSQYRSSQPDLGYSARGAAERWDAERFANEGARYTEERERDIRISTGPNRGYHDEYRDMPIRSGRPSMAMEREREEIREREYYKSPSPPPMRRSRPGMGLRRQSSLDTFDRRPAFPRYVEREEYGPPAMRRDFRRDPIDPVPLPRSRALGPPPGARYVEKEYERVEVDGPERAYYREPYPERVREREIVRTRRRSRSSSSSSSSSASSRTSRSTRKSNLPKRGRTRMPAKLVSKRAIIELGYPFEEEGEVIIIQSALGREHIDEVIQLSEKYKSTETKTSSNQETIVEEKRTETFYAEDPPIAPPPMMQPMPIPAQAVMAPMPPQLQPVYAAPAPTPQIVQVGPPAPMTDMVQHTETRRIEETTTGGGFHNHVHRSRSMGPTPRHMQEYYQDPKMSQGALMVYPGAGPHAMHGHDSFYSSDAMIRRDIRSLAAEQEALKAERRAQKELRRADYIRYRGDARASDGSLAILDGGPVVEVRKSRKGPNPRAVKMMLKTLT